MADPTKETPVEVLEEKNPGTTSPDQGDLVAAHETGPTWYYTPRWFLGKSYYASPWTQLVIISFVCFMCPGMFNAINGIGAGGQVDPTIADKQNTALYSTFSVFGFFAGTIVNRIGVRLTMSFCGIGYVLYIAAYLCYNHTANEGFIIFSGAFLGVCAGLLWAAQGSIMMSYPQEEDKGKSISWFWMIFNLGAVIGSLIPLGENINNNTGTVGDGTYAAFIVLMSIGCILALLLCNSKYVVRPDGSRVILMKHPTWKSEFIGMWQVLFTDWYIILLFPMFFSSNFFYTYHFQVVNLQNFTLRTRSLNGVLYYIAQIIGAYIFGYGLDSKMFTRRTRAKICIAALFVFLFAIWGGGYAFQKSRPIRPDGTKIAETDKIDWTDSGAYIGPMFLYMFYGAFDAAWQTTAYWFMGSLSNNARKLACFAGFYKGIQSAGAAAASGFDSTLPPFMTEFAANWGLLAGGLVLAAPVIWIKVQDTVTLEEDLKFSDETIEEVVATDVKPTVMAQEQAEQRKASVA